MNMMYTKIKETIIFSSFAEILNLEKVLIFAILQLLG